MGSVLACTVLILSFARLAHVLQAGLACLLTKSVHELSIRLNGYQHCLIHQGRENNLDTNRRDHSVVEKTRRSSHEDIGKVNKQLEKKIRGGNG